MVRKDHEELLARIRVLVQTGRKRTTLYLETNNLLSEAAKKVDNVDRHGRQYRNKRSWMRQLEDNLPHRTPEQWEVIVYEDFVAQYNFKKVKEGSEPCLHR